MKVVDQSSGADLDPENEQGDSRNRSSNNNDSTADAGPRTTQWGTGEGRPSGTAFQHFHTCQSRKIYLHDIMSTLSLSGGMHAT